MTGHADAGPAVIHLTTQALDHGSVQDRLARSGDFPEYQHGSIAAPPPPFDLVPEDAAMAARIVSDGDPAIPHFQLRIERARDETAHNVGHAAGVRGIY
jgi:hypothetical protein